MQEELIGTDQPQAWAAALAGVPHGFHHTWACCHAAQLNTGLPTYLYRAERDGVRVVCPFSERCRFGALDLVTPYGYSGFAANGVWPGFAAHWHAFARSRGAVCGYLAQHPEFGHAEHEGPHAGMRTLYLLDLADGAARTLERVDRSCRRGLRAWREGGNAFVTDRARLMEFLLAHHAAFMRRVGASSAALLSEAALRQLVQAEGAHLVGAGPDGGEIEAVCLFGATAYGAEGLTQIGTVGAKRHTVALIAWGVETLAAQRVPWLNLGGGAREDDAIATPKLKWRPRVSAFRRLMQIYRADEYERLCALAGVSPALPPAGYFPPYHAAFDTAGRAAEVSR